MSDELETVEEIKSRINWSDFGGTMISDQRGKIIHDVYGSPTAWKSGLVATNELRIKDAKGRTRGRYDCAEEVVAHLAWAMMYIDYQGSRIVEQNGEIFRLKRTLKEIAERAKEQEEK